MEQELSALKEETRRLRQQADMGAMVKEVAAAVRQEINGALAIALGQVASASGPAAPGTSATVFAFSAHETALAPVYTPPAAPVYTPPAAEASAPPTAPAWRATPAPVYAMRPGVAQSATRRLPVGLDAVLPIIAVVIVLMVVLAWVG